MMDTTLGEMEGRKDGRTDGRTERETDRPYFTVTMDSVIKISMIYVYIKLKLKKWYNSTKHSSKWSLYCVITWKLLFGKGDFSRAGNQQIFCYWVGFSPHLQTLVQSFGGRGRTVQTWWEQQARLKEGTFLVRWGIQEV